MRKEVTCSSDVTHTLHCRGCECECDDFGDWPLEMVFNNWTIKHCCDFDIDLTRDRLAKMIKQQRKYYSINNE